MDFFGHAAVASWHGAGTGLALGAMLPDFAGMILARPPPAAHSGITEGIRLHHRTDAVFHDAPAFRELSTRALEWLEDRGLRRGSARAIAHVGVEMLLDAAVADDAGARAAYLGALDEAREAALGALIGWPGALERARFAALRATLAARGLEAAASSPELVGFRLARALVGRPRLALDEAGERLAREWAVRFEPEVRARGDELVGYVRGALGL